MTTVADLVQAFQLGEHDALLTLRDVSRITGEPISTLRRWAYHDKTLPVEYVGPTKRVRVRRSVVVRFFPATKSLSS